MDEGASVECTSPDSVEMADEWITGSMIYKTLDQRSNTGNVAQFGEKSFGRLFSDSKNKLVGMKSDRDSTFDSGPSSPNYDFEQSEFDFNFSN